MTLLWASTLPTTSRIYVRGLTPTVRTGTDHDPSHIRWSVIETSIRNNRCGENG
jgi:hypothetical protein